MKKINLVKHKLLNRKREAHFLKKAKRKRNYKGIDSVFDKLQKFKLDIDKRILYSFKSNIYNYLVKENFITNKEESVDYIKIPSNFNLSTDYENSVEVIKLIIFSLYKNVGNDITLDFSKCNSTGQSILFFLRIMTLEIQSDFKKIDKKLKLVKATNKLIIIQSKIYDVNLHLFLCGLINDLKIENGVFPLHTMGYMKGSKSQKHYTENRKGLIATNVVNYLDKCLKHNELCLSPSGNNELGNLIGEILNNAEDHSPLNTFYVAANYYVDYKENKDENVGILHLSFMNFGFSIFEGLEKTKEANIELYETLMDAYTKMNTSYFSKENIFTLYALQDGISRLKYEDQSRGTGTMTFINCFYSIGDYENEIRLLSPKLSIISGNTHIICNNKYKPQPLENGNFILALNKNNSLIFEPDKENLLKLRNKFPGTILSIKFCLNKEHINSKAKNE